MDSKGTQPYVYMYLLGLPSHLSVFFFLIKKISLQCCVGFCHTTRISQSYTYAIPLGFVGGTSGKEPTCQCRTQERLEVPSLGWEDPLEEDMATHSCILAWRVPGTEEPGELQSLRSQRIKRD